ncbi:hypothetical protein LOC68_21370 [Blastopirellula sp. JC732]|uniref:Uncharacterized protein n=1 Tax=Blastopirellula sediminis TaxID=2894196 RepID=A0A9X1MP73_9BACT|nr:hypothetical protein [Blastopirellula sediminis]MCC9605752.1 hypothetical protein [Blastopirellula sediminis]MCC9630948.1 hypothetical protein [Blastopirellula sediminis]
MTLIVTLIVLNIPVYWVFGWALFLKSEDEPASFWEITWKILCGMSGPVRKEIMTEIAPESGGEFMTRVLFYAASIAAVGGEYYLLTKYVWPVE